MPLLLQNSVYGSNGTSHLGACTGHSAPEGGSWPAPHTQHRLDSQQPDPRASGWRVVHGTERAVRLDRRAQGPPDTQLLLLVAERL